MVEGWDEDGRLIRVGNAWVALVVRSTNGDILVRLTGGGMLVARGSLKDVLAGLRGEHETMH